MDKINTTGVIDQTIYGDTGNVMYIVNVELNENIVKAQSINYSSKTKSLKYQIPLIVCMICMIKTSNRLSLIIKVYWVHKGGA